MKYKMKKQEKNKKYLFPRHFKTQTAPHVVETPHGKNEKNIYIFTAPINNTPHFFPKYTKS